MPTSVTAIPKCAMTIPQVDSGVRRNFRPTSGRNAEIASIAAIPSPAFERRPPGIVTIAIATTVTPTSAGTISRFSFSPESPLQLSNGPTQTSSARSNASGPATALKYGAPTDNLSPVSASMKSG